MRKPKDLQYVSRLSDDLMLFRLLSSENEKWVLRLNNPSSAYFGVPAPL
jgi:hypothetical protein